MNESNTSNSAEAGNGQPQQELQPWHLQPQQQQYPPPPWQFQQFQQWQQWQFQQWQQWQFQQWQFQQQRQIPSHPTIDPDFKEMLQRCLKIKGDHDLFNALSNAGINDWGRFQVARPHHFEQLNTIHSIYRDRLANLRRWMEYKVSRNENGAYDITNYNSKELDKFVRESYRNNGSNGSSPGRVATTLDAYYLRFTNGLPGETNTDSMRPKKKQKLNFEQKQNTVIVVTPEPGSPFYLGKENEKLYIRKSGRDICESVWDKYQLQVRAVGHKFSFLAFISGTPGIGKSWTVNVMIWYLVNKRQDFWFHSAQNNTLMKCEFVEGVDKPTTTEYPGTDMKETKNRPNPGTWFLYDAIGNNAKDIETVVFKPMPRGVPCVIFSSPNPSNYTSGLSMMHKPGEIDVKYRYMPTWSLDELKEIIDYEYDKFNFADNNIQRSQLKDLVVKLYDLWGGVPRQLFAYFELLKKQVEGERVDAETYEELKRKIIDDAKGELKSDMMIFAPQLIKHGFPSTPERLNNMLEQLRSHKVLPNWLVHVIPKKMEDRHGRYQFSLEFCSPTARLEFFMYLQEQEADVITSFFWNIVHFKTGVIGTMFELYLRLISRESVRFWYKYNKKEENRTVTLPICKLVKCDIAFDLEDFKEKIIEFIKDDQNNRAVLIGPTSDQQEGIDMFIIFKDGRVYAMQNSICKTHSFHPAKILEYKKAAKEALEEALREKGQDLDGDFFHHVVVLAKNERHSEKKFELGPPTIPEEFGNVDAMQESFEKIGLTLPEEIEEKIKGLLLDMAASEVKESTWVLFGMELTEI